MSSDSPAASSSSSSGETSRRRLLTFLGIGGVGALAALFGRGEAKAGHDGTNVLHLGESNHNPPGSGTVLDGNSNPPTLSTINDAGRGQALGVGGSAHFGANTSGCAISVNNDHTGEGACGLTVFARTREPTISGVATGEFGPGISVQGISGLDPFGQGPGIGVLGMSGTGDAVSGLSQSGSGVRGHSETGVGGNFSSASGRGLQVDGRATIFAHGEFDTLIVENQSSGELTGAISATAHGGKAVEGVGLGSETVGVVGVSGEGPEYGTGRGTGVRGLSGTGIAVHGFSGGTGTGVDGESQSGFGVRGISNTGIGVHALNPSFEGFALAVSGKSRFSTAGSAVIPAGENSAFVPNPAVTGESHLSVTLVGDPGPRQVAWVERSPGAGFTVHLTSAPPRMRPATPITYLAVEPG